MVDQPSRAGRALALFAASSATLAGLSLLSAGASGCDSPPAPPPATTAPSSVTPSIASSAAPPSSAAPLTMSGATAAPLQDGPIAPPAALPGEQRVRAVWDAVAQRPSKAVPAGTPCTVEATIATTPSVPFVVRGLTVRCGTTTLYDPDGVPPAARVIVDERPTLERGSFVYTLRYRDERTQIDTPHGRAGVVTTATPPTAALLLIANESRPVPQRLLPSTPDERVFHAGSRPSPEDDDRAAGKVKAVTGDTLVKAGARCDLAFHYYGTVDNIAHCDVLVQCGAVTLVGRPELFSTNCERRGKRVISAVDPKAQPADKDPGMTLDERSARLWNDAEDARWSVTIALDPR